MNLTRRPHLLVFNQYYWPGVEATAHLLTELCEALAEDYDVTVITGRLHGREHEPDYETPRAASRSSACTRRRTTAPRFIAARSTTSPTSARALRRGLFDVERPDIVLCMTDPPMVGDVALAVARRYRVPLVVISQDVFPEIAVELKRLRNPLLVELLRLLTSFYLRRADRVVAIGETMQRRLEAEGCAVGAAACDPELGRHRRDPSAAARTTPWASRARRSTAASSSCTRATSAMHRTSTR